MNSEYHQHQLNGLYTTPNGTAQSRSIAIIKRRSNKPHRGEHGFNEEQPDDEVVTERMYDWATWRMYARIVDHRVKYPVSSDYESSARTSLPTSPVNDYDAYGLYHGRCHRHLLSNVGELPPALYLSVTGTGYDDGSLEGEIFDLEL